MANKVDIPVVINGKVYTLSGYEGEDYLQNVATYINGKIAECKTSDQYRRMNTEYQGILLALNIADDYFKAKNQADSMVTEDSNKEQQLYDLLSRKTGCVCRRRHLRISYSMFVTRPQNSTSSGGYSHGWRQAMRRARRWQPSSIS